MPTLTPPENTPNVAEATWHAMPIDNVLAKADVTPRGLNNEEAKARLAKHGPNVLEKKQADGPLVLLWRQINSPLVWVLIASAAVAIVADPKDGIKNGLVILAVVILNTIIGFVQEYRAGKAIEALADMVPDFATVERDGAKVSIPVAELVPGDIVHVASGDKVPADVRLIQQRNLQIIEAALTGESVAAQKDLSPVGEKAALGDRRNMMFGGTLVSSGVGSGVVVATGARTELGRISTLLKEAVDLETPLTKALAQIGKLITIGIVAMSSVILAVGTIRAMTQTGVDVVTAFRETLIPAIALAVGAIPEGLPAIVTIALAIGVQRMAQRRAIIRKLPAVETLGSTTVICSDKTGTLTRNEMTVQQLWTPADGLFEVSGVGYAPEGQIQRGGERLTELPISARNLLEAGALCNDSSLYKDGNLWTISGDPTEGALVVSAEKAGIGVAALRENHSRLDAIPFESEYQFMATLNALPVEGPTIMMKGAPEVVLRRCVLPEGMDMEHMLDRVESMAAKGMRVLAVASKPQSEGRKDLQNADVEGGLVLLGFQGMIDPPRPEAIEAIAACHRAGITVKMITGDHQETARAIGDQIGILNEGGVVPGSVLAETSDQDLRAVAMRANVFARVAPEHKLRLVKALQAEEQIVAMTGDGVNDAPALKQSNIGVAMGITGTAVSKEASDIVLTDDNFASISAAVEEGRRVYDNLIKSLAFVLPTNLGLALILSAAVAFFPFVAHDGVRELLVPVLPTQLLWINLVATVALALPLAFEAKEPDVMRRKPRSPKEPVLSRFVLSRTVLVAFLMAIGAVALFQWEYQSAIAAGSAHALAMAKAQTMAVTTVIVFQIFYMMNCRSLKASVFQIGFFSNPTVFYGIGSLLALQAAFIYMPALQQVFGTASLSAKDLLVATLVGAIVLPVISIEKWWRGRSEA